MKEYLYIHIYLILSYESLTVQVPAHHKDKQDAWLQLKWPNDRERGVGGRLDLAIDQLLHKKSFQRKKCLDYDAHLF